jgi:hypothetical protein
MVREVAGHDLPQPFPLFRDWLVHPPSQFLLDFLELRPHAVAAGLSLECEAPLACLSADEGKAQELEGFRFAESALSTLGRRKTAKPDEAGLFRVKRQRDSGSGGLCADR